MEGERETRLRGETVQTRAIISRWSSLIGLFREPVYIVVAVSFTTAQIAESCGRTSSLDRVNTKNGDDLANRDATMSGVCKRI